MSVEVLATASCFQLFVSASAGGLPSALALLIQILVNFTKISQKTIIPTGEFAFA
jgi:hypothetical protein